MAFKSFHLKLGRVRLYSGNATPFFFEIPFRGTITAPVDRPRPPETIQLDRGRHTEFSHYLVGSDEAILAPLPISLSFRMANTEPNYSKLLTIIRGATGSTRIIATNKTWNSTKGTSSFRNADVGLGIASHTTPAFVDTDKFCVNIEALWEDPDNVNDRGFKWAEVYFPQDRQLTEGENDVVIDLSGEVYGAITLITAFSAGTES